MNVATAFYHPTDLKAPDKPTQETLMLPNTRVQAQQFFDGQLADSF